MTGATVLFICRSMMTTAAALDRIRAAVLRDDLEERYIDFLNEAIHHLALRHSWIQMKTYADLVVPARSRVVALPLDFKEFQNGRFPAVLDIPYDGSSGDSDSGSGERERQPVPVFARQEIEHLPPSFRPDPHLVYQQDDEIWRVVFPEKTNQALVLTVYYFAFPPPLFDESGESSESSSDDAGDSTALLEEYPDLVIEKALAIAFKSINDPVADEHLKNFEDLLPEAVAKDVARSQPAAQPQKD